MRRLAEIIYGLAVLAGAVVAASIIGTVMALPFVWMRRGPRERITIHAAEVFGWTIVRILLLARPRIHGQIDLPPDQGALIICNHRSWMDPPVLGAWTSANGLSKRQILYLPAIGFYAWLTGAVFVDRRSKSSRERARDDVLGLLRHGCRVAVFPEGTRTRDGTLREKVYLTLLHDCYDAGLPVVPCAVWGTELALPTSRPAAVPGQPFDLIRGTPIWPREHANATQFADACWGEVRRMVKALEQGDVAAACART